jgi:WD40 repeat protein
LLWNLATRHNFARLVNDPDDILAANKVLKIDALAFSPNGKVLATGDNLGHTFLWNVATRGEISILTDPTGPRSGSNYGVAAVAFSPDGKMLATGDENGRAYLWNVATGASIAVLDEPGAGSGYSSVDALAFSPDGSTLATGNANGDTYVWNVASRVEIATLDDGQSVDAVAFSPASYTLATGDSDTGKINLWNTTTWRTLGQYYEPDSLSATSALDSVTSVAFSPDGSQLATSDTMGNTYLWNAATGDITATYTDPGAGILGASAVAFSPDGSTLATGDTNSSIYLWDLRKPVKRAGHPATSPS